MDEGGSAAPAAARPGSRWTLQLEHVTPRDDALIPGALIPFAGRVLVGAGNKLWEQKLGNARQNCCARINATFSLINTTKCRHEQ
jgi:hypothetical protein